MTKKEKLTEQEKQWQIEDNKKWRSFGSEVTKGWRVSHSEALDQGYGIAYDGQVVSIKKQGDECPECGHVFHQWYEVKMEYESNDWVYEKLEYVKRIHPYSFTLSPGFWTLRRSHNGWVAGTSVEYAVFEPPGL